MTTPTTNTKQVSKADSTRPGKAEEAGPKRTPRKRHGLDAARFDAILARQGSRCAICGSPQTDEPGHRLAVDHDHSHCPGKTGCPECVRGLLCIHCNNILRSAKDDPAILRTAIDYLAGGRPSRMPSPEGLAMLFPDDYRLLPIQGRRDRLYMHLLADPFDPQTLAEVSWMEDNDPTGLALAISRMDRPGGAGSFEAGFYGELARRFAGPEREGLIRSIRAESRRLTMDQRPPVITVDAESNRATMEGRISVDGVNLEDINAFLRRKDRDDRLREPAE